MGFAVVAWPSIVVLTAVPVPLSSSLRAAEDGLRVSARCAYTASPDSVEALASFEGVLGRVDW